MKLLGLLLLTVAAIYLPGLKGDFVFDDYANIVRNPSLHAFDGSLSSLIEASTGGLSSPVGRPLSLASFALNLYFGGETAFTFKLVNLLIHLSCGLFVYGTVLRLWPKLVGDSRAQTASCFAAAAWLLHPINLTPVLFVVQRMTSLSAFFTLAALLLYLIGSENRGYKRWLAYSFGLLICWPAAILAKETALLLPLFILLIEWLALGNFRGLSLSYKLFYLATLATAALGVLFLSWPLVQQTYLLRDFTVGERLLTQARVLWGYISQILAPWPYKFSLHHDDIEISRSLLNPTTTTVALVAWLVALGLAVWQRHCKPWLTFGILWFLAGHALESSILGLEIAYEHRNYLPSIGIFLILAALLLPMRKGDGVNLPRLAFTLGFLTLCGLITGIRSAQWGDEYIRTQVEANTHPKSARTNHDAAQAILARQLPKGELNAAGYFMARIHFQRAAKLDHRNKSSLASILFLDCAVGAKQDTDTRKLLFQRLALEQFTLGDQGFVQNLSDQLVYGTMCLTNEEAEALLTAALSNPTATGKIRGMLHAVAMDYAAARIGSMQRARFHAEEAIKSDSGNAALRINLIRVLIQLNDLEATTKQYAELIKLRIPPANRNEVESLRLFLSSHG